jgi:phosphoribosylaminoimidazolecarboxamide formyltransferase/IMP cyclohydrolase
MADIRIERALVSVYDKTGLVDFVRGLVELGVEIISTGGTRRLLLESGIRALDVSEYTGYPEMMDGRVKTLHPRVHGGLLAVRDNPEHLKAMKDNQIRRIDLVVVNLYPFEATIAKPGVTLGEAIEQIDIGGPSMIRSAAKNHAYVTVVTSPSQYMRVLQEMRKNRGATTLETRSELAREVFRLTSHYDRAIAKYLETPSGAPQKYPPALETSFTKVGELRYG